MSMSEVQNVAAAITKKPRQIDFVLYNSGLVPVSLADGEKFPVTFQCPPVLANAVHGHPGGKMSESLHFMPA